jgi:hypothetical protein
MESKKINQLATEMTPTGSDLTIIGDPITGVSRKITLLQLSATIGTGADLQGVTDNGATTTNPIAIGGLTITGLATGVLKSDSGVISSVPFGAANGVATLGGDGKVPSIQLPSYVDDVVEVANFAALPVTGETGKIYITLDNNKVYRWTGSIYVEIAANNAVWGAITGTLSNQTDLQNALNAKVPYTGATANVDLGLYELSAQNAFLNGVSGINGGNLFLRQDIDFGQSAGYTTLYSTGKNLGFVSYVGSFTYNALFSLNSLTNNSTRTFTLPDLSGTLALLEGSQTFTGSKTFSATTIQDAGIVLKDGVYPTPQTGYVGFASNGVGITIVRRSGVTSYNNNFQFPLASNDYNFPNATGTIALTSDIPSIIGLVPYTGATANVDLGTFDLTADVITGATGSFASSGGSDTFAINHSSGSGVALNITKGGNGEGLYINKTSGSGNAATIIGTLNATTLVKSGGTSSQFLKADGSVDSNTYVTLDTTQTISGEKTFTGDTTAIASSYFNLDGIGGAAGSFLNIKQYTTTVVRGVGYSSIGAYDKTQFIFYLGNTTAFNSRIFKCYIFHF